MRKSRNNGYVIIFSPDHPKAWKTGYVYEHILVAERKLGRFLTPNEIVHHVNEDRTDNSADNLVVMSQSQHAKHHMTTGQTKVTLLCGQCHVEFLRRKGQDPSAKHYKSAFCSRACYWESLRSVR